MSASAAIAKRIEDAFERSGVRSTPQRFFVMRHLLKHPEHATVEELWMSINKHSKLSRATVYNTLHALVDSGLVREFTLDGKAARYDAHLQPHHHFVCDRCGGMEDVEWFDIPALSKPRHPHGRVRSFEVVIRGTCQQCL